MKLWRWNALCNALVLVLYITGVFSGPSFIIHLFIVFGVLGMEVGRLHDSLRAKKAIYVYAARPEPEPTNLCGMGVTRDYERKLVEAGVLKESDMTICSGEYCQECRNIKQRRDYVESIKAEKIQDMYAANILKEKPKTYFDDFYDSCEIKLMQDARALKVNQKSLKSYCVVCGISTPVNITYCLTCRRKAISRGY